MILLPGGKGFVGSAFTRLFEARGIAHESITRDSYAAAVGQSGTILINASANSRKYLADEDWHADFEASVASVARTLRDFTADLYVLISSVDVYNVLDDPAQNGEDAAVDPFRLSRYGFHKYLAEACVRRHAPRWLIVRLAGMVGPGMKKNPVFDVLHGRPLSIHPDSGYQFMSTDAVAEVVWRLIESGMSNRVVNVCGQGVISPRAISELAGKPLIVSPEAAASSPRVVHVNTSLAGRFAPLPDTAATIAEFVSARSLAWPAS
jgi:nucleoside-diphosphate-sugar epimerase